MTRLVAVGVTHRGRVRERNEDCIGLAGLVSNETEGETVQVVADTGRVVTCLVADGLGGHPEGGRAARFVARALSDALARADGLDRLAEQVQAVNRGVHTESRLLPDWSGMGSTVVAVAFHAGQVACVNVGDSPCYRISAEGVLVPLSVDDSPVAPGGGPPPPSNLVTQTLGGRAEPTAVEPHVHLSLAVPGERFLLCSDGLSGQVPLDAVEDCLAATPDPVAAVRRLLKLALDAGAPDNVSVVLVTLVDWNEPEPEGIPRS